MRLSRMMLMFVLALFALAAASPSWAQPFSVTIDGAMYTVVGVGGGQALVLDSHGNQCTTCTVESGPVAQLKIISGSLKYKVKDHGIADGVEITTDPGDTCVWKIIYNNWYRICN